jgi:bifunctional non-homologous end joining protein LigD
MHERSWNAASESEIDLLDTLGPAGDWTVGGRDLRLTNLDKVLAPPSATSDEVTKRDLIRHVAVCAGVMMPYLAHRPVNMHRFPNGTESGGFWHKAVPSHAPDWLQRWHNDSADPGETEWYIVPDGVASLVWMANFGALELHPWTSTCEHPDLPTWALIDIDPGERTTLDQTLEMARLYRSALEHVGVEGRPKVTGRRGVQIWVPVATGTTFEQTRTWVETLSRAIGHVMPEVVSWSWRVEERGGLARLDYTQNARNKTLVAPFSPRAAPGAPVSVTLEWEELDDPDLRPDRWTVADTPARLAAAGDPLAPFVGVQQHLPEL